MRRDERREGMTRMDERKVWKRRDEIRGRNIRVNKM